MNKGIGVGGFEEEKFKSNGEVSNDGIGADLPESNDSTVGQDIIDMIDIISGTADEINDDFEGSEMHDEKNSGKTI